MIFYFSGTGNTKWAAEEIAKAIDDQLYYIPDEIRKDRHSYILHTGERIGFCFPTHGWQVPGLVRAFIRSLKLNVDNHFCWALTTCGDNMGEAMTILNHDLAANKDLRRSNGEPLQAESVFSVIMPESYVCLPFMKTDPEDKEAMKLDVARHQLPHISNMIRERRRGVEELDKGPTPRLYSYVIGEYFNRRMVTDKKFTVDKDKCTRCGKCQKVCPVDNIHGTPPAWLHNGRCTSCLACYHYCPVHAINYGKITRKRDQYYFNRREDRR